LNEGFEARGLERKLIRARKETTVDDTGDEDSNFFLIKHIVFNHFLVFFVE
jgi:hypothetical protein